MSTLVQVMAWCYQAPSHYLSQSWPRSLSPYGVTRPQWVNTMIAHALALCIIRTLTNISKTSYSMWKGFQLPPLSQCWTIIGKTYFLHNLLWISPWIKSVRYHFSHDHITIVMHYVINSDIISMMLTEWYIGSMCEECLPCHQLWVHYVT